MRYRFAGFTLDMERRELTRGGERIAVQPKVLDVLQVLLGARGLVVGHDELLRAAWPDVATTAGSLSRAISLARDALGDRGSGSLLRTVRGRGYRIDAPVEIDDAAGRQGGFVGREPELRSLHAVLDSVASGVGAAVFVSGEPGVGKTRLAEHFMGLARGRGCEVAWGACSDAGGAASFWPWIQCLDALTRRAGSRAPLGKDAVALATLLPGLAVADAEGRGASPSRFRQFDAIARLLYRTAADHPVVLVLDDLQWADRGSLQLLRFVAAGARPQRLLLIATLRAFDADPEVQRARIDCQRTLVVSRHLPLSGLSRDELGRLAASIGFETLDDASLAALHQRSGGNPLYVGEILRSGAPASQWPTLLPKDVLQVIARRVAGLSAACQRALELLAVIDGAQPALLGIVSGIPAAALGEALREAERAGLLVAVGSRHRFSHALVRDCIYQGLDPGTRADLHRLVGEAMESLRAEPDAPSSAEIAHHFGRGMAAGTAGQALAWSLQAARDDLARLAFEEMAAHYGMALDALPHLPDAAWKRSEITLARGDALHRAGAVTEAEACFWEAIDLARELGDAESFASAAEGLSRRRVGNNGSVPTRRIAVLEEALAHLGPDRRALRARVLAALAADLYWHDLARAADRSREAVAMARESGDSDALFVALDQLYHFRHAPSDAGARADLNREMLDLALESGDLVAEFDVRKHRLADFVVSGRRVEIDLELAALAGLETRIRQPSTRAWLRIARAQRALWRGELREAEALVEEGDSDPADPEVGFLTFAPQIFLLRHLQGRLGEIEPVLLEGVERFPRVFSFSCALGLLLAWQGRIDEAGSLLAGMADDGFGGLRLDSNHALNLGMLGEICAAVGDRGIASDLYARLLPHAGSNLSLGVIASLGSADRVLGLLAACRGNLALAHEHLEQAVVHERRMGAKTWEREALRQRSRLVATRAHGARAGVGVKLGKR